MLSTYHGYMLGYWTYIAEHTTNDGISFCMNDTFWRFFEIVMSLSIMVIIIIITTFLTNYISGSIEVLYFLPSPLCQASVQCVFENGFLRGKKKERSSLVGERCSGWLPGNIWIFPGMSGLPGIWVASYCPGAAGRLRRRRGGGSHSARSARRRQRWETALNT